VHNSTASSHQVTYGTATYHRDGDPDEPATRILDRMTITAEPPAPRATGPAEQATARPPRVRSMRYEPPPGEFGGPPMSAPLALLSTSAPPPPPRAPLRARSDPARRPVEPDDRLRTSAHAVLRLLLDVLDGWRPAGHLAEHLAPPALRYVRAASRRGGGRSRLTSVRICRPAAGAAEVAAVYRLDGRARALAARFEQAQQGTWRCVAVRIG